MKNTSRTYTYHTYWSLNLFGTFQQYIEHILSQIKNLHSILASSSSIQKYHLSSYRSQHCKVDNFQNQLMCTQHYTYNLIAMYFLQPKLNDLDTAGSLAQVKNLQTSLWGMADSCWNQHLTCRYLQNTAGNSHHCYCYNIHHCRGIELILYCPEEKLNSLDNPSKQIGQVQLHILSIRTVYMATYHCYFCNIQAGMACIPHY